jgi:predicted esterase
MKIYFAHGKESGPWGTKIIALADMASRKNIPFESIDYSDLSDPNDRVARLREKCVEPGSDIVLVGSSMGGYVSTVATKSIRPAGLFLMAPAFYLSGYGCQNPKAHAGSTIIIHGWGDEVVPVDNSIRFARQQKAELHLVDGDHQLIGNLPFITALFSQFLDNLAMPPKYSIERLLEEEEQT